MAQCQRGLYVFYREKAVADINKEHSIRSYCFVVDYGQNMELPLFNGEQPGPIYYYSGVIIPNLGMVDHTHRYPSGKIGPHMYTHIYTEGIGKKGSNNVVSLIVKTLEHLGLLRDNDPF